MADTNVYINISIYIRRPILVWIMPVKYTVTLTSVGTSGVVTIPKPVIEGFGLQKGQKLKMTVTDDKIVIEIPEKKKSKE